MKYPYHAMILIFAASAAKSEDNPAGLHTRETKNTFHLVASKEKGWPKFRGPKRNGIATETGLLQSWPENGPPLIWKISGLGYGYSSPVIGNGRIYITGDFENELRIFALDMNGGRLWQAGNGRPWKRSFPGARSSCTIDGGCIYHRNAHGRVVCLDAETGKALWSVDTLKRFEADNITWGISECLLVSGGRVYVTAGGKKALMCALDKPTQENCSIQNPFPRGTL